MKEEKRRKKQRQISEDDQLGEGSDSDAPRSNRSKGRLDLYGNSLLYANSVNNNNHKNEGGEDEEDFLPSVQQRDTPRLPPIQRPIGTKFNEESPVRKLKKKKKKPKLKALKENLAENDPDAVDNESYNYRTVSSEAMENQMEGELSVFQKASVNSLSNIEVNATSSFRRAQKELSNEGHSRESLEEEAETKSRKKKKKGSKMKSKGEDMVNGYGHDLATPRTLAGEEGSDIDDDVTPRRERLKRSNAMEGKLYVTKILFMKNHNR